MNDFGPLLLIVALLFFLVFLFLYILSLIWIFRDAERRGKNPWLVVLLAALLSWPTSLLFWLVFRPELPAPHAPS